MIKKIAFIFLCLFCISLAQAAEQIQVCGKYQRADYSWSHGYKLTGSKLTGEELSKSLNRSNKFNSSQEYFIIRWKKGGYTYYEIDYSFPNANGTKVRDQNNKPWEFRGGWNQCQ